MERFIILVGITLLLACCTKKEPELLPSPPTIILDSPTSIYTTKCGREIIIAPTYENLNDATFEWIDDQGNLLGTDSLLHFSTTEIGRYFITIKATNRGGSTEEELRVDVLALTPPTISLAGVSDGLKVLQHSSLELSPDVASLLETTYSWNINNNEVSTEKKFRFPTEELGEFQVTFSTHNEDGKDSISFTINVCSADEIDFKWAFLQEEYNVSLNRTIRLMPVDIENAFDATFTWRVNGETVQQSEKSAFAFEAETEGKHDVIVEMKNQHLLVTHQLTVNVCPPEGKYKRPASASSSALWNKVYEFLPAPGQFVNENYTATTMEEACDYAQKRMEQTAYVSLGGFGGYIIVGFDHSVENDGDYNLAITGNAFDGSSEPGIVWVMQDENGDGLPNDTWYELAGSEYGKEETWQDYAVTYYRPNATKPPVQWTDNHNQSGSIDYLGAFHKQDYYYPAWVAENSYTLRGTRLQARNYDKSGNGTYWINGSFDWGYVDNFSSSDRLTDDINYNAAPADNHFKISNAKTFDGKDANLKYIDFVKIQVGTNAKSGWLGENSTEVFGVKDFNLLK